MGIAKKKAKCIGVFQILPTDMALHFLLQVRLIFSVCSWHSRFSHALSRDVHEVSKTTHALGGVETITSEDNGPWSYCSGTEQASC